MKVLIADDEPTDRLLLRAAVHKLGHECLQAASGTEAWEVFQAHHPDVVISDWRMPGVEGPELCRRMRAASRSYVYFILASGLNDVEHVLEGMRAGADDYLSKPIGLHELEACLIAAARVTQLHRHLADSMDRRGTLLRLARNLSADYAPGRVMLQVLAEAVQLVDGDGGEIARWNAETGTLVQAARHHQPLGESIQLALREASASAAIDRKPAHVSVAASSVDNSSATDRALGCAVIAAPLQYENELLGTLAVWSSRPGAGFAAEDAELLELLAGITSAALATNEAFGRQRLALEELERLNKAKTVLVSTVSHEFRTPLTGIQGFSEMIRDEKLTVEQMREFADDINKDAMRLNRLLTEMLDLDRLVESSALSLEMA